MARNLTTRPAESDDRSFLLDLYATTREHERLSAQLDASLWSEVMTMQFAARQQHYETTFPAATSEVIEVDGVRVGHLAVERGDDHRLIDIALLPGYRGQGIGGRILVQLIAEAEDAGVPLWLHVDHDNGAIRLYKRLGFEPVNSDQVRAEMRWLAGDADSR